MTAQNYPMWPFWRDKYYNVVDALNAYYHDVVAAELSLRLELIRIEAYQGLVDKLMGLLELAADDSDVPLWPRRREDCGYVGALNRYYVQELQQNEPLRVSLQNILDAEAALDKWMTGKVDEVALASE